nr:hypothetical protein [Lentilactobacillus kosonis]
MIADGAKVVGPIIIGDNSVIGTGASSLKMSLPIASLTVLINLNPVIQTIHLSFIKTCPTPQKLSLHARMLSIVIINNRLKGVAQTNPSRLLLFNFCLTLNPSVWLALND